MEKMGTMISYLIFSLMFNNKKVFRKEQVAESIKVKLKRSSPWPEKIFFTREKSRDYLGIENMPTAPWTEKSTTPRTGMVTRYFAEGKKSQVYLEIEKIFTLDGKYIFHEGKNHRIVWKLKGCPLDIKEHALPPW